MWQRQSAGAPKAGRIAEKAPIGDNTVMHNRTNTIMGCWLMLGALALCSAPRLPAIVTLADGPARVTFMGWTNAWRISNGATELFVVPEIGARIVGYRLLAETNVMDVHPHYAGAAVRAAQSGARTLLLERGGFLGGAATMMMVNPIMPKGIVRKVCINALQERISAHGGLLAPVPFNH